MVRVVSSRNCSPSSGHNQERAQWCLRAISWLQGQLYFDLHHLAMLRDALPRWEQREDEDLQLQRVPSGHLEHYWLPGQWELCRTEQASLLYLVPAAAQEQNHLLIKTTLYKVWNAGQKTLLGCRFHRIRVSKLLSDFIPSTKCFLQKEKKIVSSSLKAIVERPVFDWNGGGF